MLTVRPLSYMKLNLDSLRAEIESYLDAHGIIVFHSHPRTPDTSAPVYWDTERHPEFKMFLSAAESAGAKIVTVHARIAWRNHGRNAAEEIQEQHPLPVSERSGHGRGRVASRGPRCGPQISEPCFSGTASLS